MHYLGFLHIEFQAALFKATGQNFLQMFRLRLAHAMTYRVIGIAFKLYMRVMDAHPLVERVMEKLIGKNRSDYLAKREVGTITTECKEPCEGRLQQLLRHQHSVFAFLTLISCMFEKK